MVDIGYTMMTEQAGPRELVGHVVGAECAGFDFIQVGGDHQEPYLGWAEQKLLPALRNL